MITIPVIGDMRGMEARPLILPQVKLPNGSTYDVMVLPSMANVVRGVDAVWSKNSCGMAVVLQYPAESLETAYWASGFLLANFL